MSFTAEINVFDSNYRKGLKIESDINEHVWVTLLIEEVRFPLNHLFALILCFVGLYVDWKQLDIIFWKSSWYLYEFTLLGATVRICHRMLLSPSIYVMIETIQIEKKKQKNIQDDFATNSCFHISYRNALRDSVRQQLKDFLLHFCFVSFC